MAADDDSGENLEERIDDVFEKNMKGLTAKVFKDEETYKATLPIRSVACVPRPLKLYEHPYWSEQEDLHLVARHLETNLRYDANREYVRYMCSKSESGKTASILPCFLESAESQRPRKFFYYIYLACTNNNGKSFYCSAGQPITNNAFLEGAAFMYESVKAFLDNKGGSFVDTSNYDFSQVNQALVDLDSGCVPYFKEKIETLLRKSGIEEYEKVLLHFDEHGKMRPDEYVDRENNVVDPKVLNFRKGAMATLAEVSGVTVVATFTEILDSVNKPGSSGTCRYALPVPILNIRRLMKQCPEFSVDPYISDSDRPTLQTILAGLRFRLAYVLTSMGFANLHRPTDVCSKFMQDFEAITQSLVTDDKIFLNDIATLRELSNLCTSKIKFGTGGQHKMALELLVGLDETTFEGSSSLSSLVVVEGPDPSRPLLSRTLRALVEMKDEDYQRNELFAAGSNLFAKRMLAKNTQLLASSPLEAAYAWVLSCASCVEGHLIFGARPLEEYRDTPGDDLDCSAIIRCTRLKGARLFRGTDSTSFHTNPQDLDDATIYYAGESEKGDYEDTHPLCDIFFRTPNNELFLIDITGGGLEDDKGQAQ